LFLIPSGHKNSLANTGNQNFEEENTVLQLKTLFEMSCFETAAITELGGSFTSVYFFLEHRGHFCVLERLSKENIGLQAKGYRGGGAICCDKR